MNSPLSIALVAGFLGAAGVASLWMAFHPAPVRTKRAAIIDSSSTRLLLDAVLAYLPDRTATETKGAEGGGVPEEGSDWSPI